MHSIHLAVSNTKWAKCGDGKIIGGHQRSWKAFPAHPNINNISIIIIIIIIIIIDSNIITITLIQ
jgi:hypothetical protein